MLVATDLSFVNFKANSRKKVFVLQTNSGYMVERFCCSLKCCFGRHLWMVSCSNKVCLFHGENSHIYIYDFVLILDIVLGFVN